MTTDAWSIFNSVFSFVLTLMIVYFLVKWREKYSAISRFGLGLMGGCGLMRISVILEMQESPFFQWVPTLFTLGVVLFIFGCFERERRHAKRNAQQMLVAQQHHAAKGM